MTRPLEIALWLIFASISIGGLGLALLMIWVTLAAMARVWTNANRPTTPSPISVPSFGTTTIRNSFAIVATFWLTLLVLIPLLVLALWQFAVELDRGVVGGSLLLAIVHLLLIWLLLALGTRVQRKVGLSTTALAVHPVIGPPRELFWNEITRVDDVTYAGPGVSGLYIYKATGAPAVLDIWLPNWESVRMTVRKLTPDATWSYRRRGWLIG